MSAFFVDRARVHTHRRHARPRTSQLSHHTPGALGHRPRGEGLGKALHTLSSSSRSFHLARITSHRHPSSIDPTPLRRCCSSLLVSRSVHRGSDLAQRPASRPPALIEEFQPAAEAIVLRDGQPGERSGSPISTHLSSNPKRAQQQLCIDRFVDRLVDCILRAATGVVGVVLR